MFQIVAIITVTQYNDCMPDAKFFTSPISEWQRRYEALRASFVERIPAPIVAKRFGYSAGYIRLLRHFFVHGKIDFSEPVPEGKAARRGVTTAIRLKIRFWREQRVSAGEIAELLSEEGIEISVRTVERILAEEGFSKLPRRIRLKLGITVNGASVPERSELVTLKDLNGQRFESSGAGIFLFAPFIAELGLDEIVQKAGLPGSKAIPALSYFLSFLSLKLLGTERYSHVCEHTFDPGLGLFAGLNALPKCTAMSTYSYSLNEDHILRLQKAFVRHAAKVGLYDGKIINLDFHTIPHYGDESVLEKHWAGARGKVMKGALTLFAQDAESKLILYSDADIQRDEADSQVLSFLSFWKGVQRGVKPTLVFDSKFTTYEHLAALDVKNVKFITLRRRGAGMLKTLSKLEPWHKIHIPHAKRKFPNPEVHESRVTLKGYDGEVRQIVVRGNGHEKPAIVISNDFDSPVELLVGNYSRRWQVENGIAEAVKFFHLNSLSSPILTKVHYDVAMTVIADTLYSMLAKRLRGFEQCDARTLHRHFIKGKGTISVRGSQITVGFRKRAHHPIHRAVQWDRLPHELPGIPGAQLQLEFE